MGSVANFFERVWYGESSWQWILSPLSWLFGHLAALRRRLYRGGILQRRTASRPVVVVGNITAGGTGKTPVTLWLAERLKAMGHKPGIVSRGYGGRVGSLPVHVSDASDPAVVGDEPLLMARRIICPVAVHPDRVAAAELLADMGCDVIIADDGLQHYRLDRQFEIAVVDGSRGFGNGRLMPAGPLREPVSRLDKVDRIMMQIRSGAQIENSAVANPNVTRFTLAVRDVQSVRGAKSTTLSEFNGQTVHAVAGIGNPKGFFDLLEAHSLIVIPHPLPDHAKLSRTDIEFGDGHAVIMTEKDAVKCANIAPANSWFVTVGVEIAGTPDMTWLDALAESLREFPEPRVQQE